jgi:hypothetical protein
MRKKMLDNCWRPDVDKWEEEANLRKELEKRKRK